MTARTRAGINLATVEASHGALPEVRQLARRMAIEQQAQVHQMDAWSTAANGPRPP